MANYENQPTRFGASVGGAVSAIDEGLRAHMLRVYNYMGIGLVDHRPACLRDLFAGDHDRSFDRRWRRSATGSC